jgi:predicted TIM-barrel enzyme
MIARDTILAKFRDMIARGEPIVGGGAGTGLSAKCEEAGGIDLIVIYNSGRYRMAGRGSLAGLMPYGDANAIVVEMAAEVLPVVKHTPVLAGVCATDPFRLMDVFLDELKRIGFSRACRTSRPWASSTARSARTSRRRGCPTGSRST